MGNFACLHLHSSLAVQLFLKGKWVAFTAGLMHLFGDLELGIVQLWVVFLLPNAFLLVSTYAMKAPLPSSPFLSTAD